ncbi:hypothetical protein N7457_002190 [Penicillium paradoxum]|uniref:uncharacterized protein n=1 Tax=Penicillium paradoxum TaxID=176176 RepID=UPI0025499A15|nr:uncharacterized protein N7457_002190 [Penicillium paradoxum]KAJ5787200.1 hypothetical protein N7457_002190 [Penicillium paradoxum]
MDSITMAIQSIPQSKPTRPSHEEPNALENPIHLNFMREALEMGEKGLKHGETPVGCILVLDNQIVARGINDTNRSGNGTRHAEFIVIAQLLKTYPRSALQSTDLYVTVEPCVMCASALKQYRIRSVYFGCGNARFGGIGGVLSLHLDCSIDPSFPVYGGLFEAEAIDLMRRFYALGNKNAPISKVRNKRLKALYQQKSNQMMELSEVTNEETDEAESVSPYRGTHRL